MSFVFGNKYTQGIFYINLMICVIQYYISCSDEKEKEKERGRGVILLCS
jgi:hypothetical protein